MQKNEDIDFDLTDTAGADIEPVAAASASASAETNTKTAAEATTTTTATPVTTAAAAAGDSSNIDVCTCRTSTAKSDVENIPFWFHNTLPKIIEHNSRQKSKNKKRIYSFIQEEGETVFVPSGWHHAVLNLEPSVAISHNFVSKNNKELFLIWLSENLEEVNLSAEEYLDCVRVVKERE